MDKRVLLLVFDGLGDRPVPALGGRTPLQAARTENLDWLAARGASGLLDLIAPGVRPGSDTAHLALFGYDPYDVYTGRGPFEAAGVGLEVKGGDVALRCNFATVDDEGRVLDRRAGRIREGTAELAKALTGLPLEDVEVHFKEGTEHRAALLLRGADLDPRITDGDPHTPGEPLAPVEPLAPEAKKTARVVNAFLEQAREALADHPLNARREQEGLPPANAVLSRGAGRFPSIPAVGERWGLRFAAIAGVALIKGICRAVGMEVLEVPGATGGLDADLEAKVGAAVDAMDAFDVVVLHVKSPDIAGHDRQPELKRDLLEKIDASLAPLREGLRGEWIVAVTGDHSTSSLTGEHTGDPVPLLVSSPDVRRDGVGGFDEVSAAQGGLGRLRGVDVLPLLLDLADRTEKFGA